MPKNISLPSDRLMMNILRLKGMPGTRQRVKAAEPGFPDVMTFAGDTCYAKRHLSARKWCGKANALERRQDAADS